MKTDVRSPPVLPLLACCFAAGAVLLWVKTLSGADWAGQFEPLAWHEHELVFGFALVASGGIVLAGSGIASARTPRWVFVALTLHWLLARTLMWIGPLLAAAVANVLFPLALLLARPSVLTKHRGIAALLVFVLAADAAFFLEQAGALTVPRGAPALAAFYALVVAVAKDAWDRKQRWDARLTLAWSAVGFALLVLEAVSPSWGAASTHAFALGALGSAAMAAVLRDTGWRWPVAVAMGLLQTGALLRVIAAFVSPLDQAHAWLLSGAALIWCAGLLAGVGGLAYRRLWPAG